ncbi:MAG: hypothetical protein RIQ71_354 [Verrucomicrobiota bacterium]|jgi:hypothetical protein
MNEDTPGSKSRFHNRAKRIARRTERDNFRRIIMPAFYVFCAFGWAVYLMSFIYSELTSTEASGFFGIAAGPTIMIGLMETYRLMRGHHSRALEEP